jgi:hypothetical protein
MKSRGLIREDHGVLGRDFWTEVDDDVGADMRVLLVSEERERRGYRFGRGCGLGRGPISCMGRKAPPRPFLPFPFSFLFSFLFFIWKLLQLTSDLI